MENKDSIFSDLNSDETEVTPIQGFLTRLIDFGVDILILFILYKLMPRHVFLSITRGNSFMTLLFVIVVFTVSRFLLLIIFSKTIGMMICRVKFLNGHLQPLSTSEKLLSLFRSRFSKIKYYKDK
jgi:uncharacterized RDD family membrane protein YckC